MSVMERMGRECEGERMRSVCERERMRDVRVMERMRSVSVKKIECGYLDKVEELYMKLDVMAVHS